MAFIGTSKFLKFNDASAPQISGAAGSLIAVLKQALVYGYGSGNLGWTLEFEDAPSNVAVFKMGGGTRSYVRVDDSSTIFATITIFSTMSDVNTGAEPLLDVLDTRMIYKSFSYTSSIYTSINSWYIIGDASGFWINVGTQGNLTSGYIPASQLAYIGDYISVDPSFTNTMCAVLSREVYTNTSYRWPTAMSVSNTTSIALMHRSNGVYAPHYGTVYCVEPGLFGNNQLFNGADTKCYGYPIFVKSSDEVMGQLPGLVNPFNKFLYDSSDYLNSLFSEERQPFVVQDVDENDLAFSCMLGQSGDISQYGSQRVPYQLTATQRLTIRIGEGFRNVY